MSEFDYKNEIAAGDSLTVKYESDIQKQSENSRYDHKEERYGIKTYALKVKNNSNDTVFLTQANFKVLTKSGVALPSYTPITYNQKIRQHPGSYFLYLLFALGYEHDENSLTHESTSKLLFSPVGGLLGLAIAVLNYNIASEANDKNLASFEKNTIWNKPIPPRSTRLGLISLKVPKDEEFTFKYNKGEKFNSNYTAAKASASAITSTKSNVYEFNVVLTDHTTGTLSGKIDNSKTENTLSGFLNYKRVTLRPVETLIISRPTTDGLILKGFPSDSVWLFRIISGKISAFFTLAETHSISHIQKGTGPIIPFSVNALFDMIGNDPDAFDYLQKKNYQEAIKTFNKH